MIPEPRYETTMPSAMPAVSEPEPSPRIANRTICFQSIRERCRITGGPLDAAPPVASDDAPPSLRA